MCGIAGLLGDFVEPRVQLRTMLNSLVHRGPDEEGEYAQGPFTGGMRRLSINDLAGGSQPLFNRDRSVVLFYNGEIYNYCALRSSLEAKGTQFRTHSDGEVIPHLYDQLGEAAFEHLDGMYAAALWDSRRQLLLLARDIPGEKPLYYAEPKPGQLIWASEVKALERAAGLSLTLDRQALWDFPTFLWIPEPRTVYEEVHALPRGHVLVAQNGKVTLRPYANRFTAPQVNMADDREAIAATRCVVEAAVKSRLLSDVPVGSFLSGGLDSSIVATVAARELPTLDTFTVAFEDVHDPYHGRADESADAAETAARIGSRHHIVKVTAETFRESLGTFCNYGDMPFSVSSGLGILAIAAAAREAGIKVLLTGDGADEAFGGYSWYAHLADIYAAEATTEAGPVSFQNFGLSLEDRMRALSGMSPARRAWAWHYYADESEKAALFSPEWRDGLAPSIRHFESLAERDTPEEFVRQDRNFYFPNEMLRKVDRMAMAHSVEGRTPFAAPSVLALADTLRLSHMVRGGELKWVLRRAFEDILPQGVVSRPKHGFNVPIDHWLQGEWSDLVDEAFDEGSSLRRMGIVNRDALTVARGLLADPVRLNGHTVFSFIMLNKWLSRDNHR